LVAVSHCQLPRHLQKAFKVGDVIVGLISPLKTGNATGTWAEYALLPVSNIELKPPHLTPEQAVASFMSGMVAVVAMQKIKPALDAAIARCTYSRSNVVSDELLFKYAYTYAYIAVTTFNQPCK
jgi:uncharacterized protein (DUF2236 family)